MAKSKAKKSDKGDGDDIKVICRNRKASHDFELLDRLECGIVLVGTEVKSLREGHANLEAAYARVDDGELFLLGCEIPEYAMGNQLNHKPMRTRKLLARRREIGRVAGRASEQGLTLVPTLLYFKGGRAKVEIAVAKGKQLHDKREAKKKAEARRDIQRALSERRR